jgi:hypothetical protein
MLLWKCEPGYRLFNSIYSGTFLLGWLRFERACISKADVEKFLQFLSFLEEPFRHDDILLLDDAVSFAKFGLIFLQKRLSFLGWKTQRQLAVLLQKTEHIPVQGRVRHRITLSFDFRVGRDKLFVAFQFLRVRIGLAHDLTA